MIPTPEEIKAELDNGPAIMDYGSHPNNDDADNQWIADRMNLMGASNETLTRDSVSTSDIVKALYSNVAGFKNISQLEATKLNWLSPIGSINPADLQAVFLDMFPDDAVRGGIRTALIALATRSVSRAQKLGWDSVTKGQIHNARVI